MDAITHVPEPQNEPVREYAPGSPERASLEAALTATAAAGPDLDLTNIIDGVPVTGSGEPFRVRQPHAHGEVLGTGRAAGRPEAQAAVDAAARASAGWRSLPYDERAAVLLRAADLISGPWRDRINAATMLGQSKTAHQAEIDAACELADFWRFNVHFGRQILTDQPVRNTPGTWNRMDHRPLEGFVYAVTPFNFTAIAGNLPTAPALMGNTVVWKPAPTQQRAASVVMEVLSAAGLPPGVVNMLTGDGLAVSDVVLTDPALAGIHFTGSTRTFRHLWQQVGINLEGYRTYPRVVGETGGKDFVVAHPSADVDVLRTALVRGAFEYQGQKCSAASRAYVPRSLWPALKGSLVEVVEGIAAGDVRDLTNFMGAVIDETSFRRLAAAIDRAHATPGIEVIAGGTYDDTTGWFVRPTVLEVTDPADEVFHTEYFGPILAIHVYDDSTPGGYDAMLDQMESLAPYALTGAVIADDRDAVAHTSERLRFAAGNFYVNDKPTGAVVGQQPFGGARASGTNDKAGSILNLLRWVSPRVIKETFVPPTSYEYPFMG